MASPFPGMDPYLEGDVWTPFQTILACEIVKQLVPKLRPRYLALPEKRFIELGSNENGSRVRSDLEPHTWVQIREARHKSLVTVIEILSPTNKNGRAREEYLKTTKVIYAGKTHLIEIDLVRQGQRLPRR